MSKYIQKISTEELSNIFNQEGFMITNLDEIKEEQKSVDELEYLFVKCFDIKKDNLIEKCISFLPPMVQGIYSNYRTKLYCVYDFGIQELFELMPEYNYDRNLSLNKRYIGFMSDKFGEYANDLEEHFDSAAVDDETPEAE